MKIRYFNRRRLAPEVQEKYAAEYCSSLHDLLAVSDVVSVNCPLNTKTTGLIGKTEFAAMKDGVFLVNTARGPIVDEVALKASHFVDLMSQRDC